MTEKATPHLKKILTALLMALLLTSLDNTIVATALGAIVSELGEIEKFTWVTSFYMIAGMPSMLIFGKLSDMYGRKIFFIGGLALFLISSVLCGSASTMTELSLYRALQGVGGGALMPISFTIVFDCYPPKKRGKIMALFGVVFGLSSLFGPIIGSTVPQFVGWQWIFYINIPIGLIAGALLVRYYHESHQHTQQTIDWAGVILLIVTICATMVLLLFGGSAFSWFSYQSVTLIAFSILSGAGLWFVEQKATSPILPISLFRQKLFSASQCASFFYGMIFIALLIYTPLFLQGVMLLPISAAGMVLMPMMLGVVVGAQVGGQLINRFSFRNILLFSIFFVCVGLVCSPWVFEMRSQKVLMLFLALLGAAVGANFSTLNISATHGVPYHFRGSANSSVIFFRQMGMAIGVTIYGLIFNEVLFDAITGIDLLNISKDQIHTLLDEGVRVTFSTDILTQVSEAFYSAISLIFKVLFIPVIGAFFAIIFMGSTKNLD